ncbi:type I phosphomannose isomerase catalytic subunit [Fusobacterium sp. PH5-44]|uniref:type I phosphomannose isomerase catalytic subunit n=1 Tax=unclassified Fusobacterium TaxID=2648384 RepID=UPI003D1BD8FD
MGLIKLAGVCKNYMWGGTKLREKFLKNSQDFLIAESWELSCHRDGKSTIINKYIFGQTLKEYIENTKMKSLGYNCKNMQEFPILIKFIDAKEKLSIQVHPDNEYSLRNEGEYGKTEAWYIIEAEIGAFIYYGLKKEITKKELKKRIENNTFLEVLNKVFVKKGDIFLIEPGMVHAIGSGILLAEIQQASNITYRIYDYDRVDNDGKRRKLHIKQGLDVIKCCIPNMKYNFGDYLIKCKYFQVEKIEVNTRYINTVNEDTFHSLLFIEGDGIVRTKKDELNYREGDSFFLDAGTGEYSVNGSGYFLLTSIPPQ